MVINRYIFALFFVSAVSFCGDSDKKEADNLFIAAVVNQVNKVSKKSIHKSPVEYRQAVERYISVTRLNSLTGKGKKVSYEIELQYLFDNFARFSTVALLYRLRLAHCDMVKNITDVHSERYRYYEQICSALLLQCTQKLSDNARKQLLDALHEIDDHIVYWRYQKSHPLRYCFGKSPLKWVMGKKQEKEVSDNIKRLERRQAELYIIVGRLTTHVHSFTECDVHYADCYTWIEELLSVLSCIKIGPEKIIDGTRFDKIAAQLELKIKQVGNLKYNSLCTIAAAKKSNHLVRHWIAYTAVLAITSYIVHYYINNPGAMFATYSAAKQSSTDFFGLLLNPLQKIYDRGKLIFSEDTKLPKIVDDQRNINKINEHSVIDLLDEVERVGKEIPASIAKELAKSNTTILQEVEKDLDRSFDILEQAGIMRGCLLNSYTIDRVLIKKSLFGDGTSEFPGGNLEPLKELYRQLGWSTNYDLKFDILVNEKVAFAVQRYLDPLQKYTNIIDDKILRLIELIALLVARLGKEADEQLQQANSLQQQADAKMKDHELLLMFTALIPLAGVCFGAAWTYRWITSRNYSPIRIALADVNSLLIESPMPLDDYDYGKLVYLVHKLRNKAHSLKDALCNEFLVDITKLESKRFDVAAKRGIVDNMFNKYAFLGRIAV